MIKKKIIPLFIFCSVMVLAAAANSADAQKTDSAVVRVILGRLRNLLAANVPNPPDIQKLMNTLQPDGSWKGIDYRDTRVSNWPAYHHLTECVLPMAESYANEKSPLYGNKTLGTALHRSLDYWLDHNFTSRNWWSNEIGVPNTLTDILILMDHEITPDEFLQALNQMRGSGIDQTGQNRVWRAEIQLKIGLLSYGKGRTNILGSPEERIREASNILQQEVVVRDQEGIQPDWSFHQHGVQQQFGNYGLAFASAQAHWAYVLANTPYAYDHQKITVLRNYILNGLSDVIFKGVMDISGCGRQLSLNSPAAKGSNVLAVLALMAKADPEYAAVYQQVAGCNTGTGTQPGFLVKNTYFWRSDLMVNRWAGSYASVRMCSKKIQSTESGNGENLLGSFLSDGATYLYRTGKEYENIFPVWNWHRIPGVTSYIQTALPPLGWQGLHNESDFVGGVSDSASGIAAMLFRREGLTAHKSWFFIPAGVVCLGAGIHSDQDAAVSTTVNQDLLEGEVMIKTKSSRTPSVGAVPVNSDHLDWVYHDHTGYLFLQKENVHVSAADQEGSWKKVNVAGSPEPLTKKVFTLWIDHGSKPGNESYAYMEIPNTTGNMITLFQRHSSLKVLENDTTVQAIRDTDHSLTQMVFYHPGKINLDHRTILGTSGPCLVMAHLSGKQITLTLSTPPELEQEVDISLSGHYACTSCTYDPHKAETSIKFSKPGGGNAGRSLTQILMSR